MLLRCVVVRPWIIQVDRRRTSFVGGQVERCLVGIFCELLNKQGKAKRIILEGNCGRQSVGEELPKEK